MSDGRGHQRSLPSPGASRFPARLSIVWGFVLHTQLARCLLWIQRGRRVPHPGELEDVRLLLTQEPPNELSVNESEADGSIVLGNTPRGLKKLSGKSIWQKAFLGLLRLRTFENSSRFLFFSLWLQPTMLLGGRKELASILSS